ncbi:DUF4083 family protein [Solibacillus silvestris]|uniref:DUF4083 family protein n=1 Tax=Solibacillus silvestris TaxID=76853 RepID=UPI003F7EB0A9
MAQVNIGDIISTTIIFMLIVLILFSLFLLIKNGLKRNANNRNSSQQLEKHLQNIEKQNEEIIKLLKKKG